MSPAARRSPSRAVSMEEILSGKVRAYQQEIDAALGLDHSL